MKHTHYLAAAAILSFTLIGCADKKPMAIAFSNTIIQTNDSLQAMNFEVARAGGYSWATKDFSKVGPMYNELMAYIDKKSAEIEKMEDVGGSDLKAKELAFLQYEKNMMSPVAAFKSFNANTPEEKYTETTEKVIQAAEAETLKLAEINLLLQAYAKKNEIPYVEPKSNTY